MQKAAQVLHNAASEFGRSVEALKVQGLQPNEQKLVAVIVGATTQAVLSKLAEALQAAYEGTPEGQTQANAINSILKPPLPPVPPRRGNDFISEAQRARQDAIRDFARKDNDGFVPPSSAPG